nr:hypothetical protein [Tanacetum cinerariifolium]
PHKKVLQRHTTDFIQKYSMKLAPESSKIQTPTIDPEQEPEKTASEIRKKSALYQTMHENKSFNKKPANHALYHAFMKELIEDENAIDKGVANTLKNHKRQHDDDDEDPSAGPDQGKKTKRRRTKE